MKRFWTLYGAYMHKAFVAVSQFRTDAILGSLAVIIQQLAAYAGIWAILYTVGQVGGWGIHEVALIYAFFLMTRGLGQFLFDGVWNIGNTYIRRGRFDETLIRPASPFFQLLCNRIEFGALGVIMAGIVLLYVSLHNLALPLSPLRIFFIILFVILGTLINSSVYLIFNSLNFWLVQGNQIALLIQSIQEFAKYPIHAFSGFFSTLLSYVVPFAFATYYPAAYILGYEGPWVLVTIPIILAVTGAVGRLMWIKGLRSYNSVGT